MYQNGQGCEKNYETAVKYYRMAAEQGYSRALSNLGFMYNNGYGVAKDYTAAVKYYQLAADLGYEVAENNLGVMYHNGHGVERDHEQAVKYYQRSADKGYSYGQFNLATMYMHGCGIAKNVAQAVKYYKLSADQGYIRAQLELADIYREGKYGKIEDCFQYYQLAANQKNERAIECLEKMLAGEYGATLKLVIHNDIAEKWPTNHDSIHPSCQKVIYELFFVLNELRWDIPKELYFVISRIVIINWKSHLRKKEDDEIVYLSHT